MWRDERAREKLRRRRFDILKVWADLQQVEPRNPDLFGKGDLTFYLDLSGRGIIFEGF